MAVASTCGAGLRFQFEGWIFCYQNRVSTDDAQVDGHLLPLACRVYGSVDKV